MASAVACLGVGFAAVNDTLTTNGAVNIAESDISGEFDKNVFFTVEATPVAASTTTGETGATVTGNEATVGTGSEDNKDTLTVTLNAGTFTAIGQKVIVTAAIENTSTTNSADIVISAATSNGTAQTVSSANSTTETFEVGSFEVKFTLGGANVAKNNGTTNGSQSVTIEISLKKLPSAAENNTFVFTVTATPAA